MYLNDKKLSDKEQKLVDDFVFPQIITKTNRMMRRVPGIRIMDRPYLDLFAFSRTRKEVLRKARELYRRFDELGKRFEDGDIFFLTASEEAFEERLLRRSIGAPKSGKKKGFDAKTLKRQEQQLAQIYRPNERTIFNTTVYTAGEIAKEIARKILLHEYSEFLFEDRLMEIIRKGGEL